jgi:hypothetical protein
MAKHFTIDSVVFDATACNAIGSVSLEQGVAVQTPQLDGEPNAKIATIMEVVPEFSFDTQAILTALGLVDDTGEITGISISTLTAGLGVFLAEHGVVGKAAGNGHQKMTVASGVIVPVSLSLTQGQPAVLTMQVIPAKSDGTDPIAFSTAARPAYSAVTGHFTLGTVKLNGTSISDDVQSVTVNFNFTVERVMGNGRPFPKSAFITQRTPTASITFKDSSKNASLGVSTALNGTSGLQVYITSVPADNLPDALAATTHGCIQFENGFIHRGGFSGAPVADNTYTVVARADSSGNIVNFTSGVAQ